MNEAQTIAWASDPHVDGRPKVVAVVGLSNNPERPSHEVAAALQRVGYRVIPVNPKESTVLGQTAYPTVGDIPDAVDIIDVFRAGRHAPAAAQDAAASATGARVFWMQEGVVSEEAARIASQAGMQVVMDRCLWKEYARHRGR